jgi:glycerophosphoryl diester phosphodiesterase
VSTFDRQGLGQSLIPTPAVVGHRGASGERPEHTLEAYRLAIRMGADDIELDLVITADGVLVARHDATLFDTTDVGDRVEFADRRTTKVVDGAELTDWFVEDFTFAELRTLTARERFRKVRKANLEFHGRLRVPSLDEVLTLVALESQRARRTVGVMLELKHAAYFEQLGLSLVEPVTAALQQHGLDHPRSRVTLMSFETTVLRQLDARTEVSIVQLIEKKGRPADLVAAGARTRYSDMVTPAGLAAIEEYADGIGVHKHLVLPRDRAGHTAAATSLVADAHERMLTVYVWTLRAENRFLARELRSDDRPGHHGNLAAEARMFLAAGVDGLITDNPDVVLTARADHLAELAGLNATR